MKFFRHLSAAVRYQALPATDRLITFYCEGPNYWPHLEGLLKGVLERGDFSVCYVSSHADDPGLAVEHPRLHRFEVGEGFLRNWFFENLQTGLMVTTTPDLDNFQYKRSRHPVHYIYVQHSLVSLHMIYREGAFDHFDTLFCAGPHHKAEARALEQCHDLPPKRLFDHGYGRLDAILAEAKVREGREPASEAPKHVLIAPSWGEHGLLESGLAAPLVANLLAQGARVTLRPHPQTLKLAPTSVGDIVAAHKGNTLFVLESGVAGQASLHDSDIMISDWSGAALEYAFGLGKPVLFADVPRKVNNPRYCEIEMEPVEVSLRAVVGRVFDPEESARGIPLDLAVETNYQMEDYVFNAGRSAEKGADFLCEEVRKLETSAS